jgi:hypothetical protein
VPKSELWRAEMMIRPDLIRQRAELVHYRLDAAFARGYYFRGFSFGLCSVLGFGVCRFVRALTRFGVLGG